VVDSGTIRAHPRSPVAAASDAAGASTLGF